MVARPAMSKERERDREKDCEKERERVVREADGDEQREGSG